MTAFAPENVFLILGPDLLIINGNLAWMLFVPTAGEHSSPQLLAGRVISARFAYPSFVRPVVFRQYGKSDLLGEGNVRLVDDVRDLLTLVQSPRETDPHIQSDLQGMKKIHLRRYSTISRQSAMMASFSDRPMPDVELARLTVDMRPAPQKQSALRNARVVQFEDRTLVTSTSLRTARSAASEVSRANYSSLYVLDRGVPYDLKSGQVYKNIAADAQVASGRVFAMWFALLLAEPDRDRP